MNQIKELRKKINIDDIILCCGNDNIKKLHEDTFYLLKKYYDTRTSYSKHCYFTGCYVEPYIKIYDLGVTNTYDNMNIMCKKLTNMPMGEYSKHLRKHDYLY